MLYLINLAIMTLCLHAWGFLNFSFCIMGGWGINFRFLWGCTLIFSLLINILFWKIWNLEKSYKNSTIYNEFPYDFHVNLQVLNIWPHFFSLSRSICTFLSWIIWKLVASSWVFIPKYFNLCLLRRRTFLYITIISLYI